MYLRRRGLRGYAHGPGVTEDSRTSVAVAFSIRLCGAPGAPTSNSVCGRSVMGKVRARAAAGACLCPPVPTPRAPAPPQAFGTEGLASASWGWEAFISATTLTEAPWRGGLRFLVSGRVGARLCALALARAALTRAALHAHTPQITLDFL